MNAQSQKKIKTVGNQLFDWRDSLFIVFIIVTVSLVWGSPFSGHPAMNAWLSKKLINAIVLFSLLCSVVFYAKLNSARFSIDQFFVKYQWLIVSSLFVSYSVILSSVSILRHLAFATHAFDLGIFDQAIWTVTKGKFLYSSIKEGICLLGDHMSPILLLFSPLLLIWDDVRVLLIAQAIISALCFFPLALIAEHKLGKGIIPVFFCAALYFYLPLRNSTMAEFHPEIIANPIMFSAFYFMIKERWKLFWTCLFALILCKENMYGITFIFGIYLLFERRTKTGIALIVGSILFFYMTTQYLIPWISQQPYLYRGNYSYFYIGTWGTDPPLIVKPADLAEYLYRIFLPLGFLSFFNFPAMLLNIPILFQNILSRNPTMHSLSYQYTIGLTPAVFVSAIYGLDVLFSCLKGKSSQKIRYCVLTILLICTLFLEGRSERFYFHKYRGNISKENNKISEWVGRIPEQYSVVANDRLVPHMSHRFEIRQFEDFQRMPPGDTYSIKADLIILSREMTEGPIESEIDKIKRSGYRIIFEKYGLILFQRKDLEANLAISGEKSLLDSRGDFS